MGLANLNGVGYFVSSVNDLITAAGFWLLNRPNELFWYLDEAQVVPRTYYSKITQVATAGK